MLVNKAYRYELKPNKNQLVVVPRFFPSSRRCSECGYILPELKLSTRRWLCPECGAIHDRDINAAINLLQYLNSA